MKRKNILVTIIALVIVLAAAFGCGFYLGAFYAVRQVSNYMGLEPFIENRSDVVEFTSEKLGVRFTYAKNSWGYDESKYTIVEKGNELHIIDENTNEDVLGSAFMTVITIGVNEDFWDAVVRIGLGGIVPKKCSVTKTLNDATLPKNFDYQVLSIESESFGSLPDFVDYCKSEYSAGFRSAYFVYNPAVPTKMVFVTNGQDVLGTYVPGDLESGYGEAIYASQTLEIFK